MLKKLTEAFGVSGYEEEVRNIIIDEINDYADISVDSMGNLLAFTFAEDNPDAKTVLLSAHMDEVGFIVTGITDDGYIKFDTIGGIDPKVLVSKRVFVNGHSGVIGLKPVHLLTKEERKKIHPVNELFVDIGARDREDAEKLVEKGDYFTFDSGYVEFGECIKAKALDDRIGCAVMIEMLKKKWNVNVVCAFTVQEETGLRGAKVAAKGICPDYAVVIESTSCNDMTGVPENLRVTEMGKGAAVTILDSGCKTSREVVDILINGAKKRGIPWQFKASTAGGNDSGAIHLIDGGIKTASVSVPCRYLHSPVCVISKADLDSCKRIIEGFLEDCGKDDWQ